MSTARSDGTGNADVTRLKELTADALERLYVRVRRCCGASDDDCLHDAMRTAMEKGDPGLTVGWFIVAARRRKITELRQQQRRGNVSLESSAEPPGQELLPLDNLVKEEINATVRSEFAKLAPIDQEILRLTVIEGLQCPEAAKELGIEPETARQRRVKALKRLRSIKEIRAILPEAAEMLGITPEAARRRLREIPAIRNEVLGGGAKGHE